jgi:glucosaminylphosphatidylinositol acyltransferase
MVDPGYKSAKESFVSDQTGSSQTHINLISLIAFTSLCLYSALRTRVRGFPPKSPLALFSTQFVLLILPVLGAVTYAAQGPGFEALKWDICFVLGVLGICIRFEPKMKLVKESLPNSSPNPSIMEFANESEPKEQRQKSKRPQESNQTIPKLQAVTTWRAHMMLLTCICILAVDFPVFPRSLAKCETFGVSMVGHCPLCTICY